MKRGQDGESYLFPGNDNEEPDTCPDCRVAFDTDVWTAVEVRQTEGPGGVVQESRVYECPGDECDHTVTVCL